MGKSNKANRTKGNTRPSSSGHSAQLLGVNAQALTGFIGFTSLDKETPSYVPVTGQHVADTADNTVDSDFRMVMRKMLKRDAVTRLKAVQEFGEHCHEKEENVVKSVLPFWPRLFNKLAMDFDRRIREAAHQANGKLMSKVKRDIAPYLKNIMSVWLLGQCDLYAPAASVAQTIFCTTFPTNKQADAVMFCKSEIFSYFKDNLFEQTAKTMSDPKVSTPEDMENRYILVISGTLQALKLFLTIVKQKELAEVHDYFCSIIADNKFWKFAKSKEAQIRGAWYGLISSLCQLKPDVFVGVEKKLSMTVFSNISESDPVVAPAVWESALHIVVMFENCWQGIDIHKVVLPQLWTFLKEGGKGNARALYPCLLPFLNQLPKEIVESEDFLLQFFSCFKQSLLLQFVKSSATECDAILQAFFECLKFISFVRLGNEKKGSELLRKVLMNEIIPMLESSLYDENNRHLAASKFYELIGSLLKKLEKLSCDQNDETSEVLKEILNVFWLEMLPITYRIFKLEEKKKLSSLVYLSFFFNNIFQIEIKPGKPLKQTVRFKDDCEDIEPTTEESSSAFDSIPMYVVDRDFQKNTPSFSSILKFCETLCENIDVNCHEGYLKLLDELLVNATEDFVRELVKVFSASRNYEPTSVLCFVQKVVMPWLEKASHDKNCLMGVFKIIFMICIHVADKESKSILECCSKLQVSQLECFLKKGLDLYKEAYFFDNWLKISLWSSEIVTGLQQLVAGNKFFNDNSAILEIQVYQRILNMCLNHSSADILIPEPNLKSVVQLLSDLTKQIFTVERRSSRINLALYFVHDVFIAILKNSSVCWKFEITEELVYELFHANLHGIFFKNSDVSHTLFEVLEAFIESYINVKEELMKENGLLNKIVKELNLSIQSLKSDEEAECVQKHFLFLFSSVQKYLAIHKPDLNSTLFISHKLMDVFLPASHTWDSLKEDLIINLLPSFLKNKIFYPVPIDEELSYPEDSVKKFNLAVDVISNILCSDFSVSLDSEVNSTFYVHYINEQFLQLLWCLTFNKGIETLEVSRAESFSEIIANNCQKMLSFLSDSDIDNLRQKLFDLSLLDEDWALCLQTLSEISPACNLNTIADKEFESISNEWPGLHKYVVRQILIHHLSTEKRKQYLQECLQDLVKMENISDRNFAGRMGELCCCLQYKDVTLFRQVQEDLKVLFENIIMHNFENCEDLKYNCHLIMVQIFSCEFRHGFGLLNSMIWKFFTNLVCDSIEICRCITFDNSENLMLLYQAATVFLLLSELLKAPKENPSNVESTWAPSPISDQTHKDMVNLLIHISGALNDCKFTPVVREIVLSQYLEALKHVPENNLLNILEDSETQFNQCDGDSILNQLISSLTSPVRQIQFAAHAILLKIMPSIPSLSDEIKSQCSSEDESEEDVVKIPHLLSPLIEKLKYLNELVEGMLLDVKIGDQCAIVPFTDSYVFAMAYLLAWIEVLEFISASPSQIRMGYAIHLEEMNLLSTLFSQVFRLLPENPMVCLKKGLKLEDPKKDLKLLFIKPLDLNQVSPSSEEIQSIACYVFSTALRTVPASIRTWWNNLDRKSADTVNNFTSKYVSGLLSTLEIQAVHEQEKQFENLMVQARLGSREVIATYTIDDTAIELSVQLPINYPLGPTIAERRGKVVIGQLEWRHWLMQLTTVLTYQNGSILDGLTMWKRNLDKKFEGVEECMICYYILHSSSLKLPKLSCHVCRKKFHSACLYKWFHTSNNSTCPLCRHEFAM
ncbi:e3 ubiquitin-protein ligase listerin [Trichonephila clavata]|uniref:E3 ubiquitin-protein ligase listerin n=1 Tax=Trichonephila clavata TaxID=2740835 RepID=A0A8X6F2W7_TRICU|nr:e3 ubiquitin-protein ligase listerin [Trichonephila clavata]